MQPIEQWARWARGSTGGVRRAASQVSSTWEEPRATARYRTGVSLHSHTSCSEESMTFAHRFLTGFPGVRTLFGRYEKACQHRHGLQLDFVRAFWRPPLLPKMAWDLERRQIARHGLEALVSITDHDTIEAPMLLRTVPTSRHIPVSVEWTAPFGATEIHLGIHNLPSADGSDWMRRFACYTAAPGDRKMLSMLRELDAVPGVLTVLNHPMWDLQKIGQDIHLREVLRFLASAARTVHAMELNGLRNARENREVARLARETGHLLMAGGDRHGLEPNACINLTSARNFAEFVEEIRIDRRSHVLFLDQYKRPWEQRLLESTLDAVTDFPEFMPGWQRWDERAFHADSEGTMRPLSELWATGRAPLPLRTAIAAVRLGRIRTISRGLGLALSPRQMEWEIL